MRSSRCSRPSTFYVFWRPVTAIRAADTDGNPQTDAGRRAGHRSSPTPRFRAMRPPMRRQRRGAPDRRAAVWSATVTTSRSRAGRSNVTLHYTSFRDITDDIDDARVYGGIHFRFDQEVGGRLGRRVGGYVYAHNLRPAHKKEHDEADRHATRRTLSRSLPNTVADSSASRIGAGRGRSSRLR